MSQMFEVMIFTASHSCYANVVLNILDPNNEYITYRLFRDQCLQTNEGIFIKDLRIVANRSLDNVLIVDNATYSFGFQLENGIPILPYYEGQTDRELLHLMEYLKRIAHEPDVRPFNKTFFMYDVVANYCNEFEKLIDVMLTVQLE